MQGDTLKAWRKAERTRLVAARVAVGAATIQAWREAIDATLVARFADRIGRGVLALCWPIRNEYDARHVARTFRERGALTAMPVVVAPRTPLVFREWRPGVAMAKGAMDIPCPAHTREVVPDAALLPMNGWDAGGYRLGYGGGFFDRTLAAAAKRPLVIGVTYELARMETIHPQPWDIPVDWVVTEAGAYRRNEAGRLEKAA
jgi:5,10-methenyltetrahydrofolate synthetase